MVVFGETGLCSGKTTNLIIESLIKNKSEIGDEVEGNHFFFGIDENCI